MTASTTKTKARASSKAAEKPANGRSKKAAPRASTPEKPAETKKPAEAKKPAATAAAPIPTPAPAPTATVRFEADWTESLSAGIAAGGKLAVEYAPERARAHGGHAESANDWAVTAYLMFVPGGEITEAPVVSFPVRFGKPAKAPQATAAVVDVPREAEEVQIWFRNWVEGDAARELWDSNFGHNYRFQIEQ